MSNGVAVTWKVKNNNDKLLLEVFEVSKVRQISIVCMNIVNVNHIYQACATIRQIFQTPNRSSL